MPVHNVPRAKFRAIDAHAHLSGRYGGRWDEKPARELIDVLDACNIEQLVDLDGGLDVALLERHLDQFKSPYPDRFIVFGGVDWPRCLEEKERFGEAAARAFRQQHARGAQGLKIWKTLGLHLVDHHGRRVPVDDPRLDPLWDSAAELRVPVVIHTGDPVAFFRPLDETNERYDELVSHPEYRLCGPQFPTFDALIAEFERLVARHPQTTFVGAHVAGYAENLGVVSMWLDRYPNLFVDIGARIAELGRQPHTARKFFIQHADRVLFGLDRPIRAGRYEKVFRFLETDDDGFNPSDADPPSQGRWTISGLHLPDDVLLRVYRENAATVLGLVRRAADPPIER